MLRPVAQRPYLSACHAGLLGNNWTPVGSGRAIMESAVDSRFHYFYFSTSSQNRFKENTVEGTPFFTLLHPSLEPRKLSQS